MFWLTMAFLYAAPNRVLKHDLLKWSQPIFSPWMAVEKGDRFWIVDRAEHRVLHYDLSTGYDQPHFFWKTPGKGQGPGEISSGTIKGISVDKTNRLWVSHTRGLSVFDQNGRHLKDIKEKVSHAYVTCVRDELLLTSRSTITSHQELLRKFAQNTVLSTQELTPDWVFENPMEIPMLGEAYIEGMPEVHPRDDELLIFQPAIHSLMRITQKGRFVAQFYIKPYEDPKYIPQEFAPFKKTGKLSTMALRQGYSGLIFDENDRCWVMLICADPELKFGEKGRRYHILAEVSLSQEKILATYRLPLPRSWYYLFKKEQGRFFLLDTNEDSLLYEVPKQRLIPRAA